MSDNLNELLFAYIEHMKVRNYSPSTMRGYGRAVRQFLEHLRANNITDLKRVTRDMLKAYHAGLMELKSSGDNTLATISLKIRAVKRFFEYLEQSNQILINPAEHIKEPRKETRLPRAVLSEEEALKILDAPNLSTLTGIRDRTIMEVFYSTGIRLAELLTLTIYDCDLQGGMLRVKGKFAKSRVVPLGRHAVKFLKEYITRVRPRHTRNNKQTRTLFVNQTGDPLASQTVQHMVKRYADQAGIRKNVTPHVFRHTFATQLVKNGADITAVQKMLGHAHLSVTTVYTKVAGVEVKKTHRERHPREKDKAEREEKPDIQGYYYAKPD
ncbi:MAG: site-specific tyrosine recombinase/integron integrase [Nitrospirota bacterium]